jgi:hypothetical protein
MVDNQHKQIKGYRDLSQTEIDLMNECKEMAVQVNVLCDKLQTRKDADIDGRWLAIGRTDLQKGFMALVRSIARPETF